MFELHDDEEDTMRQRAQTIAWLLGFGLVWISFPTQASEDLDPSTASKASTQGEPAKNTPSAGTLFLYPEAIPLEGEGFAVAERGTVHVPLVRSDPKSRLIGIEIYRFKATAGADPATPPIFRLNGGPGFPGLSGSLERPGYYEERILPQTEIADLVVVGQRGIGSSKPDTACGKIPTMPLDQEVSHDEQAEILRRALGECKAFWEEQGLDLRGLNVVEAAADVDAVRRALDYDKIIIDGGSFGSHWGMTVMRHHPEIVARALLSGMEGPDHTYDMPSWVLNSLERLAAEAESAEALQELVPEGGLIQALETVIARLEEEPVRVEVKDPDEDDDPDEGDGKLTVRFDADDIRDLSMGYSGRTSSRRGARTWAADVLRLYHGDFTTAAERMAQRATGERGLPTASFFMLDCGSGISPQREAELNADPAQAIVGDLGWFYQTACPVWGSDLSDDFRQNFTTEIPTVIVHGTWDTSTPYENALELAPFFKNSKMVTVKGGSHGALREALDESESFREALNVFLRTGDLSGLPDEVDLSPLDWAVPE